MNPSDPKQADPTASDPAATGAPGTSGTPGTEGAPETGDTPDTPDTPDVPGEGNYSAARRHRQSAERFVQSGQVEEAAREAEPDDAGEAESMREAEQAGRSHARR